MHTPSAHPRLSESCHVSIHREAMVVVIPERSVRDACIWYYVGQFLEEDLMHFLCTPSLPFLTLPPFLHTHTHTHSHTHTPNPAQLSLSARTHISVFGAYNSSRGQYTVVGIGSFCLFGPKIQTHFASLGGRHLCKQNT